MSIFEVLMLVCFGAAWPVSILKSWKSKTNDGKSPVFLVIVMGGYIAGIFHKIFYNFDMVIILYCINCSMILVDILIFYRNSRIREGNNYA